MTIMSFFLFVAVAACCAGIALMFVPNRIPGGFFAAAGLGMIGAWVGGNLLGNYGPILAGASLFPVVGGAAILVFSFAFLSGMLGKAKSDGGSILPLQKRQAPKKTR